MNVKKTGGLLAALLIFAAFALPTKDLSDHIRSSLNIYRVNYAPDKVYIHHDKPYYMAGEFLWLKAYVLDASSLEASTRSGVLYVDLLNDQNELVQSLTLPIADGEAHGDIFLSEDLTEGNYRLTAHTRWMRNFDEDYYFQKEIFIMDANTNGHDQKLARAAELEVDLQFFPESGDLVAGLSNEVAFKAIGRQGYGLPITASLFDQSGKKITDFKDHHAGMGSFRFTPESDNAYYAKLNFKDGQTVDYPLPPVKAEGYLFHVDETADPENILIRISANKEEVEPLMLMAIGADKLAFSQEIQVSPDQTYEGSISKSELPNGISRLTLAKKNGEPLAERLVFIKHAETVQLNVAIDQESYSPREEVKLSLALDAEAENIGLTRLSMSVTAESLVLQPENAENIQTYLLLSSDLKGHIESPGYYFESDEVDRQTALRHLMMTQGWRRFDWNDMISQRFPKIEFSNELDLNIRGRLVDSRGEPISKGEALLYLKDRFQTFITTTTNREGYFTFPGFYYKGNIPVVIQGTDARGRREGVEVQVFDRDYLPSLTDQYIPLPDQFVAQLPDDYVINMQQQFHAVETGVWGMNLDEVLLNEVIVEGRADIRKPFRLHGEPDVVIRRDQLPVAPSGNILESLQGRVAGLQIRRSGFNEFRASIRGQGSPLYLLDGMPIEENSMQMLNQFDISRIEILKTPGAAAIYGGRGGGGVIAFYTDIDFEEVVDVDQVKYIVVHDAAGFNRTRRFYSPKFEDTDYYDLPDLRSTIYWNPEILIGGRDKKTFSFFTSDIPGTYRVILEGMTEDGQPLRNETTFEVR